VVDTSGFHLQPLYDPYSALVYAARAADVRDVWVDGAALLEGGEVRTVDAAAVLTRAAGYRDAVRAGLRGRAPRRE
ncbi:MAG: hypothetical protein R3190_15480, partial [Thermoanaerobaculia bacterium]|nr:hypothetical protein [Thermoanaerobaculia bacterium]